MAQPLRSRCSRLIPAHSSHARTLHCSARKQAPHHSLSVADLLDNPLAAQNPDGVIINGFVRTIRNQKTRSFAAIGDGSSLEPLQALLTPQQAQNLSTGTAVRLTGSWRLSPNPKAQSHELHVVGVDILGSADATTFPLQKKYHTPEYLRTIPHLRTRTPFNSTLLRFRSESIASVTKHFSSKGFTQTHTPIITSSDCEGAGEVFSVETAGERAADDEGDGTFFKSPKYLTVSSQLHLEALAQSVGNVWTLSPTFRAEKSDTARHLSEFYMLEAEVSFQDDMNRLMDVVRDLLLRLTDDLSNTRVGQEILYGRRSGDQQGEADERANNLNKRWQGITKGQWPRITYSEAIKILQNSRQDFEHTPTWGAGLQAEHERLLATEVGEGGPVFVTNYPKQIKPFYMLPTKNPDKHGETVECFDLLVPEVCEIVGGSMREHRLEPLMESMRANGMIGPGIDDLGSLKWYIDLRRWGSVPHGGFGLGFDRLLGYLSGVQNIREIVTFPRWYGRCDC